MKKFLALLLALVMVFALAACGGGDDPVTTDPAGTTDPGTTETDPATSDNGNEAIDPNDIPDTMESDTYEVAFITDVGDLKDKSFNEGTWNGVKTYAYENNLSYKYYQPANGGEATDTDRYDAMKQAVDNGRRTPSVRPLPSSPMSTSPSSMVLPSRSILTILPMTLRSLRTPSASCSVRSSAAIWPATLS